MRPFPPALPAALPAAILASLLASLLWPLAAPAQAPAPAPGPPAAGGAAADPVVARVEGEAIRLSDLRAAADQLPEELRGAPEAVIYPLLLDQLVAQKALVARARAQGLDRDPELRRRVARAEEAELQQAFLRREVAPALTEEALRARFEREAAARPAEEEVRARHILAPTEAEARAALEEARRPGADFAEVARRRSTGPGAREGGDLGYFKRGDMVAEFAEAAFALRPGQISEAPVPSPFGWHVIRVEERRAAPAPGFEERREAVRQAALEEVVTATVERVRGEARVERFALDGSPLRPPSALDGASPPAPPARTR